MDTLVKLAMEHGGKALAILFAVLFVMVLKGQIVPPWVHNELKRRYNRDIDYWRSSYEKTLERLLVSKELNVKQDRFIEESIAVGQVIEAKKREESK